MWTSQGAIHLHTRFCHLNTPPGRTPDRVRKGKDVEIVEGVVLMHLGELYVTSGVCRRATPALSKAQSGGDKC